MLPPKKEDLYDDGLREGVEMPALLRRLHRSLTPLTTLSQCCSGRSKTVPSLLVQRLVQSDSSFNLKDLKESHEYIMTRMIPSLYTQLTNQATGKCTLQCLEQLQCFGRFLEFLLEFPNSDAKNDNNIPSMVLQILRACSDLSLTKTLDDSISEDPLNQHVELTPPPTALRIWMYTTLLRLNQYCHRGRPFLLSMIWKSLANLSTSFCIPAHLVFQAQSALLQHLQDRLPPILQSIADVSSSPPPLLWKIVGFLLARWTTIAPVSAMYESTEGGDEIHPTTVALPTLALLRGMCHRSANPSSQTMASHIDASLLIGDADTLLARMSALCTATMPSVPECRNIDLARIIWEAAWTRGKAHILTNFLKNQMENAVEEILPTQGDFRNKIESFLAILEELLFNILPHLRLYQCHSSNSTTRAQDDPMIKEVMEILIRSLLSMEVQIKNTPSKVTVGQFHRLMVYWLTRTGGDGDLMEVNNTITSLLSRFWTASPLQKVFQQLLLQLFWDARTTLHLRSQLATVILRVLLLEASSESFVSSLAVELWSGTLELLDRWSTKSTAPKKRKRCSSLEKSYRVEDWHIIISTLLALPPCLNIPTRASMINVDTLSRIQIYRNTLCVATWHCGRVKIDFDRLVEPLVLIWTKHRSVDNIPGNDVIVWTMAALRQVPRYFDALRSSEDPNSSKAHGMAMVIQLLAHCTASVCFINISRLEHPCRITTLIVQMIFEVIQVLGAIGTAFSYPGISVTDGVQSVAQCFHRLLSSHFWSLRSFTMTSFLHFASTLPLKFKSVLPQCVPSTMQSLLQARLQKTVDPALIGGTMDVSALKQHCMDAYVVTTSSGASQIKRRQGPIFPTQSYSLPAGSYCLTLPTQEGRRALVIFPPGPDSLLDLQGMLGEAEGENQVHQLRQKVVLSCGNVST